LNCFFYQKIEPIVTSSGDNNGDLKTHKKEEPETEIKFSLGRALYFKKAANAKYIKFEQMCRRNLYTRSGGVLHDPDRPQVAYTIAEAMRAHILKITDRRCLVARGSRGSASSTDHLLYVIEQVFTDEEKKSSPLTLTEAVQAGLVQQDTCVYKRFVIYSLF
jgi:hypothetical protein